MNESTETEKKNLVFSLESTAVADRQIPPPAEMSVHPGLLRGEY